MTEKDYVKDPSLVYHRFLEAFKFAYARRTELADPEKEKSVKKVVDEITNPLFGEKARKKIDDSRTFKPAYYEAKSKDKKTTGTTHLVVVGPEGDAVTVMSTVNG